MPYVIPIIACQPCTCCLPHYMDYMSYNMYLTGNVISTGGNTASGIGNDVYTGGNGINSYGYGDNGIYTGGNHASGIGNTIGTGYNYINSREMKHSKSSSLCLYNCIKLLIDRWRLLSLSPILGSRTLYQSTISMN